MNDKNDKLHNYTTNNYLHVEYYIVNQSSIIPPIVFIINESKTKTYTRKKE